MEIKKFLIPTSAEAICAMGALTQEKHIKFIDKYYNVAILLMGKIQYESGSVDRWSKEKYPLEWVETLQLASWYFFTHNPDLLTDEQLDLLVSGEQSEMESVFKARVGYHTLDLILTEYHESI